MSSREFEDISIPKWKLTINGAGEDAAMSVYRVFSSPTEFVTVQATSATDAVAKSNLQKVFMIRINAMDDMTMLDRSMLAQAVTKDVVVPEAIITDVPPSAPAV